MNFSILIKKACINFSVIIIIYSLLVITFFDGVGMNPLSVMLLFPFSFTVTMANSIVKYSKLKNGTKVFVYFILLTLALTLFVFLPHGKNFSPSSIIILFVVYCFLYTIGAIVVLAVKTSDLRKKEKNTEYKNVY